MRGLLLILSTKKKALVLYLTVTIGVLTNATGQGSITAKIKNAADASPVPYASVGIRGKTTGAISDSTGSFTLELTKNLDYADTVVISSIGYTELKLTLRTFLAGKEFILQPIVTDLKEVKVSRLKHEDSYGSVSGKRNLNSGWSGTGKGGEIGNLINIGASTFKLEKISFYVLTGCDTVVFRLHIREVVAGQPGAELLNGNILIVVTKQNGITDHDLSRFNILITDNPSIYVGLELIARSKSLADPELGSNVHITGHRGGKLHYKWYPQTPWLINPDYELSLIVKARH